MSARVGQNHAYVHGGTAIHFEHNISICAVIYSVCTFQLQCQCSVITATLDALMLAVLIAGWRWTAASNNTHLVLCKVQSS